MSITAKTILGFEARGLSKANLDTLILHSENIKHEVLTAFSKSLLYHGISCDDVRLMTEDQLKERLNIGLKVTYKMKEASPAVEPGLPLRQFVRGFLRDHLGLSKIVAHNIADLFMRRWNVKDEDGTMRRYREEMEDKHTLAASFDRKAVEDTDRVLGISETDKTEMAKLGFPDRPVFDPESRKFSAGR